MNHASPLSPESTAAVLPYPELARAIAALLKDGSVNVPPRIVMPLPSGGSLFVMPATDALVAITKLISFVADNALRDLPAIQGDVVVFDARNGRRLCLLDGPTVTARRTAAVSLLAAQTMAARPQGPLLVVGAGVQGRAHLEAFAAGLDVQEVWIHSRTRASAEALASHAAALGLRCRVVDDPDDALAHCPLVVSCTSAQAIALRGTPRNDAFVSAVGAFTPRMVEWSPEVCRHVAAHGTLVVDTRDADHEAGDLLQAGLDVAAVPTLAQMLNRPRPSSGPVFFKSCGWAGWDLAAARLVVEGLR